VVAPVVGASGSGAGAAKAAGARVDADAEMAGANVAGCSGGNHSSSIASRAVGTRQARLAL